MKSYIIIRPHSNTNPTSRYRVADFAAWVKFVDGDTSSYPVESCHETNEEAQAAADKLNEKD